MKFNMTIKENYASFYDESRDRHIFVDSFDNETFEVRIGNLEESTAAGELTAKSDEELNEMLESLYLEFVGGGQ
ncbi:hypothetical protein [Aurantivibrio plasticivorans]